MTLRRIDLIDVAWHSLSLEKSLVVDAVYRTGTVLYDTVTFFGSERFDSSLIFWIFRYLA